MQKPLYDFSISKVLAVCISTCTSISDIEAYIKIDLSEQTCYNYNLPASKLGFISNFSHFTSLHVVEFTSSFSKLVGFPFKT